MAGIDPSVICLTISIEVDRSSLTIGPNTATGLTEQKHHFWRILRRPIASGAFGNGFPIRSKAERPPPDWSSRCGRSEPCRNAHRQLQPLSLSGQIVGCPLPWQSAMRARCLSRAGDDDFVLVFGHCHRKWRSNMRHRIAAGHWLSAQPSSLIRSA